MPDQAAAYGAFVARAIKAPPAVPIRNSTAATDPSTSAALAVRPIDAPTGKRAPSLGAVSATLGGWFAARTVTLAGREVFVRP